MSLISAPKVDVMAAIAVANSQAVGTYMLAATSSGDYGPGVLRPGSELVPAGHQIAGSFAYVIAAFSPAMTGTWRCMGRSPGQTNIYYGVTIWKREI